MSKSSAAGRSKNSASSSSSNNINNDNQAPYQPFHRPPILYKNGSTTLDATEAWPYAIVIHETEKGNDGKKGDTVAKHISHPKLIPPDSNKRKFYWNFFHVLVDDETGKPTTTAVCNLCGRCMSIGNRGYISLGRHLESELVMIDGNLVTVNKAQISHHALYSELAKQEGKLGDLLDMKSKQKEKKKGESQAKNKKRKTSSADDKPASAASTMSEAELQERLHLNEESLKKAKNVLKELKTEDGYDTDGSEAQLQKGIVNHFKAQKKIAFAELQEWTHQNVVASPSSGGSKKKSGDSIAI